MKRIMFVCLSMIGAIAFAQKKSDNYILTTMPLDDTTNVKSVEYFDGLGRPIQTVVGGLNTQGTYLCTSAELNALDQTIVSWSPVVTSSLDRLSLDEVSTAAASLYNGDTRSFATSEYDGLGRVTRQIRPGAAWENKPQTMQYGVNKAHDKIIKYSLKGASAGFYAEGALSCSIVINENMDTTKVYKNLFGNVVLEQQGDNRTYYVYDEYNRLRLVLQPMYQQEQNLDYYSFQYSYNGLGLVVSKKLPGCEPITYEYDTADRVIEMTDGVLRSQGKCRRYVYDNLGRLKTQSIYQGTTKQYDEIENYYDYDYSINGGTLKKSNVRKNGIGQITATKQRTSNGSYILSTVIYDEYGRAIKQEELGLDNHLTTTEIEYNFVGNVTKSTTAERVSSDTILLSMVENTYAPHTKLPVSSLLYVTEYKGGKRQETKTITMQDLSYNDLGRVIANNRSGNAGDIRYAYDDLHGWVTGINSGAGFEQRMYRETNGAHPRWDGSISAMAWRTDDETIHRYDYEYDGMNRLKKADYSSHDLAVTYWNPSSRNSYNFDAYDGSRLSTEFEISKGILKQSSIKTASSYSLKSFIPASESVLSMSEQMSLQKPVNPVKPVDPIWPEDPVDPKDPIKPVYPILPLDPMDPTDPVYPNEPDNLTTPEESAGSHQDPLSSMEDLISENLSFDNNQHYNEEFTYNANSSITTMKRYGMKDTKGFGLIDNLTFGYNGNRRTFVSDNADDQLMYSVFDFVDRNKTNQDYLYNANGALNKDRNKGIDSIDYDLLGNPRTIFFSSKDTIKYIYASDGRRLRTTYCYYTLNTTKVKDYIGNLILENGKPEMYRFLGGFASFEADTINGCHYYITDYLGNNRMVVNASTDEVEQVNHYYAYGGLIEDLCYTKDSLSNDFTFGDKKLDRTYGLDLYDFEARQYDAIAPWFTSIDPLAEKYYSISPYAYCAGDPVNFIDPTGCQFTERSLPYLAQLEEEIENQLNKNNAIIQKKEAQIAEGKKVKRNQKKINKLKIKNYEISKARTELQKLKDSDQMYDISRSNKYDTKEALRSGVEYNLETDVFEIVWSPTMGIGWLAHELKHAYQFEMGEYSSGNHRLGEPAYDQWDETEAYLRGAAFGVPFNGKLSSDYAERQIGPVSIYDKIQPAVITSEDFDRYYLQLYKIANATRSTFRIWGKITIKYTAVQ